jgi:hypothetical protein
MALRLREVNEKSERACSVTIGEKDRIRSPSDSTANDVRAGKVNGCKKRRMVLVFSQNPTWRCCNLGRTPIGSGEASESSVGSGKYSLNSMRLVA